MFRLGPIIISHIFYDTLYYMYAYMYYVTTIEAREHDGEHDESVPRNGLANYNVVTCFRTAQDNREDSRRKNRD